MAEQENAAGPKLLQQAEKILLHPIHAHLISYCPTMDLIAVVTDEENLDVYRINGQRAFGLKRKSEVETVDAICWQFNGLAIAVSWSDGCTDIVSSETGKVLHRDVPAPDLGGDPGGDPMEDGPRTKCIGWGLNFIDVESVKRRTGASAKKKANDSATTSAKTAIDFNALTTEDWDIFKDDTSLEDFLQRQPDFEKLDISPDLPDQLAMMDMETLLPKLPAIPLPPANPFMMRAAQADAGAFSTQAQVDGLLHSHHLRDHNSVDMFIRCTEKGTVHPSIYDSMETVNISLPNAWDLESTPIAHASHPYACTHGLLMQVAKPRTQQKRIAYVPLTLGFIPSAGIYLHLIASKTAQLQNLLSYLTHSLSRIRTYFTHSQDLPSKFMRNISETLSEHGQADLVQNLYHLACTGHCPPLIHDWLVDELAEQGHKRWDNAVVSGLSTVIQLLHENFLPALDRCSIVISRLRGLAAYHDQDWIFSCPISDFTALLDLLKSLRLLAHTTLLYASEEKRHFASFSKWLRYSIDFEATEPDSQSRAEMEARDPGVDVMVVLEYIQYGMTKSDIGPYLKSGKEVGDGKDAASYDDTLKAIESLKEGATFKAEALSLERVLTHFGDGVGGLLKQVSQWQESNISMDSGLMLEEGDVGDAVDMRMVSEPHSEGYDTDTDADSISTYIALASPSSPSHLRIHRLTHSPHISSLATSLHTYATATLDFSPQGLKILDAKFADDTNLLILLQSQSNSETSFLISIPYTPSSSPTTPSPFQYIPAPTSYPLLPSAPRPGGRPGSRPASPHLTHFSHDILKKHTRHVFERRFTPLKLIVNGRKGRRVVVVLGSDGKHYRVLDLDYREKKDRKTGEGKEGGGKGGDEGASSSEESTDENDVEMSGA